MIDPDDHCYSEEMTTNNAIGCTAIAMFFAAVIVMGAIYSAWRVFAN